MKILLLGKNGQLGWELQRALAPLGDVTALDFPEINVAEVETAIPAFIQASPQVVINATAYTAVDRAEQEADLAFAVNARAPGVLAEAARSLGAAFVHFSTDYVFDGGKGSPYVESDVPNPLGVYGRSKLAGEQAVAAAGGAYLTLRTSWVYSLRRESFATKVLGWARQQETLSVVDDQVGNPTWARMLAEVSALLLARAGADPAAWLGERRGLYHLAGDGYASRLAWAQALLRLDPRREEQVVRQLLPAKTADFPTSAQRPLFSALDCSRFNQVFGLRLPPWEAALEMALQ
ncbi:MAG: dTDP-4-dehydrorhamnose reductase [Chloroflexi bacterium]|nr:dTDP-4-dehydrorhamnose reductase [Chloroflexota bacterium]